MNTTEERLADALRAAAGTVRPESLRPLATHDPERLRGVRLPRRRHITWLAPAAAAAAVAAVVGLSVALATHAGLAPSAAPPPWLPRHYVTLLDNPPPGAQRGSPPPAATPGEVIQVRDTATGRVTDTLALTLLLGDHNYNGNSDSLAAAADDRTFFVWYDIIRPGAHTTPGTRVYRFRVTGSGRIVGFAPVKGVPLGIGYPNAIAASPDGSKLALAIGLPGSGQPTIMIVDLATGARTVFHGGLPSAAHATGGLPSAAYASIADLSWAADGRTLAFQYFMPGGHDTPNYVRILDTSMPGGSLARSRLVHAPISVSRDMFGALISPDGKTITVVVLNVLTPPDPREWVDVRIDQISVADGRVLHTLYRTGPRSGLPGPMLRTDGSGHLLLLTVRGPFGWIGGGQLHPLPIHYAAPVTDIVW
jgi:hypothetical protein